MTLVFLCLGSKGLGSSHGFSHTPPVVPTGAGNSVKNGATLSNRHEEEEKGPCVDCGELFPIKDLLRHEVSGRGGLVYKSFSHVVWLVTAGHLSHQSSH